MLRLRSRTEFPPYEFQLLLPEVGMKTPVKGSFSYITSEFGRIVAANPAAAAKHGWPDYPEAQADWCDHHNADRLHASGFPQFTTDGSELYTPPPAQKKTGYRGVVAAARQLFTGASIWRDLFGETDATVARSLAEKRAVVCVACPENGRKKGLAQYFTTLLAGQLMNLFELMKQKGMETTQDDNLGVCEKCNCPMRAKVHAEIAVIVKHTAPEVLDSLPSWCWIAKERAEATA